MYRVNSVNHFSEIVFKDMGDKESKDLARKEKKMTPSPDKKKLRQRLPPMESNKENEDSTCRKSIDFSSVSCKRTDENENNYDHPVYKDISRKNGLINKSDLSTLKRMCKEEGLDSGGKRNLIQQRLNLSLIIRTLSCPQKAVSLVSLARSKLKKQTPL